MEAFAPEIEEALEHPVDFKSALQELLARRGAEVSYEITSEEGPPHERTYWSWRASRVASWGPGVGAARSTPSREAAAARQSRRWRASEPPEGVCGNQGKTCA